MKHLIRDRKSIERVRILFRKPRGDRLMRRAQQSATLVRAKLDLPRRVRGEHLVQPEIKILITKFVYERRQVNRVPIVDPCLVRHGSQRSDFDFTPGQRFDVKTEQMLDRVERQTRAAAEQRLVTSTRFEREVTAASARVAPPRRQTTTRPRFKLLDRNTAQRA